MIDPGMNIFEPMLSSNTVCVAASTTCMPQMLCAYALLPVIAEIALETPAGTAPTKRNTANSARARLNTSSRMDAVSQGATLGC
jgi:hypothetical protein